MPSTTIFAAHQAGKTWYTWVGDRVSLGVSGTGCNMKGTTPGGATYALNGNLPATTKNNTSSGSTGDGRRKTSSVHRSTGMSSSAPEVREVAQPREPQPASPRPITALNGGYELNGVGRVNGQLVKRSGASIRFTKMKNGNLAIAIHVKPRRQHPTSVRSNFEAVINPAPALTGKARKDFFFSMASLNGHSAQLPTRMSIQITPDGDNRYSISVTAKHQRGGFDNWSRKEISTLNYEGSFEFPA